MSKGKATVTFPDGTTYTRSTDRAYAYAVAYQFDVEADEVRKLAYNEKTLAQYESEGIERTFERDGIVTANPDVRWIGDSGLNVAALRKAVAKGRKAVEAARGKKVVWKVEAFSTKCDLVVKAAAKLRRLYPSIAFTICPVEFTR